MEDPGATLSMEGHGHRVAPPEEREDAWIAVVYQNALPTPVLHQLAKPNARLFLVLPPPSEAGDVHELPGATDNPDVVNRAPLTIAQQLVFLLPTFPSLDVTVVCFHDTAADFENLKDSQKQYLAANASRHRVINIAESSGALSEGKIADVLSQAQSVKPTHPLVVVAVDWASPSLVPPTTRVPDSPSDVVRAIIDAALSPAGRASGRKVAVHLALVSTATHDHRVYVRYGFSRRNRDTMRIHISKCANASAHFLLRRLCQDEAKLREIVGNPDTTPIPPAAGVYDVNTNDYSLTPSTTSFSDNGQATLATFLALRVGVFGARTVTGAPVGEATKKDGEGQTTKVRRTQASGESEPLSSADLVALTGKDLPTLSELYHVASRKDSTMQEKRAALHKYLSVVKRNVYFDAEMEAELPSVAPTTPDAARVDYAVTYINRIDRMMFVLRTLKDSVKEIWDEAKFDDVDRGAAKKHMRVLADCLITAVFGAAYLCCVLATDPTVDDTKSPKWAAFSAAMKEDVNVRQSVFGLLIHSSFASDASQLFSPGALVGDNKLLPIDYALAFIRSGIWQAFCHLYIETPLKEAHDNAIALQSILTHHSGGIDAVVWELMLRKDVSVIGTPLMLARATSRVVSLSQIALSNARVNEIKDEYSATDTYEEDVDDIREQHAGALVSFMQRSKKMAFNNFDEYIDKATQVVAYIPRKDTVTIDRTGSKSVASLLQRIANTTGYVVDVLHKTNEFTRALELHKDTTWTEKTVGGAKTYAILDATKKHTLHGYVDLAVYCNELWRWCDSTFSVLACLMAALESMDIYAGEGWNITVGSVADRAMLAELKSKYGSVMEGYSLNMANTKKYIRRFTKLIESVLEFVKLGIIEEMLDTAEVLFRHLEPDYTPERSPLDAVRDSGIGEFLSADNDVEDEDAMVTTVNGPPEKTSPTAAELRQLAFNRVAADVKREQAANPDRARRTDYARKVVNAITTLFTLRSKFPEEYARHLGKFVATSKLSPHLQAAFSRFPPVVSIARTATARSNESVVITFFQRMLHEILARPSSSATEKAATIWSDSMTPREAYAANVLPSKRANETHTDFVKRAFKAWQAAFFYPLSWALGVPKSVDSAIAFGIPTLTRYSIQHAMVSDVERIDMGVPVGADGAAAYTLKEGHTATLWLSQLRTHPSLAPSTYADAEKSEPLYVNVLRSSSYVHTYRWNPRALPIQVQLTLEATYLDYRDHVDMRLLPTSLEFDPTQDKKTGVAAWLREAYEYAHKAPAVVEMYGQLPPTLYDMLSLPTSGVSERPLDHAFASRFKFSSWMFYRLMDEYNRIKFKIDDLPAPGLDYSKKDVDYLRVIVTALMDIFRSIFTRDEINDMIRDVDLESLVLAPVTPYMTLAMSKSAEQRRQLASTLLAEWGEPASAWDKDLASAFEGIKSGDIAKLRRDVARARKALRDAQHALKDAGAEEEEEFKQQAARAEAAWKLAKDALTEMNTANSKCTMLIRIIQLLIARRRILAALDKHATYDAVATCVFDIVQFTHKNNAVAEDGPMLFTPVDRVHEYREAMLAQREEALRGGMSLTRGPNSEAMDVDDDEDDDEDYTGDDTNSSSDEDDDDDSTSDSSDDESDLSESDFDSSSDEEDEDAEKHKLLEAERKQAEAKAEKEQKAAERAEKARVKAEEFKARVYQVHQMNRTAMRHSLVYYTDKTKVDLSLFKLLMMTLQDLRHRGYLPISVRDSRERMIKLMTAVGTLDAERQLEQKAREHEEATDTQKAGKRAAAAKDAGYYRKIVDDAYKDIGDDEDDEDDEDDRAKALDPDVNYDDLEADDATARREDQRAWQIAERQARLRRAMGVWEEHAGAVDDILDVHVLDGDSAEDTAEDTDRMDAEEDYSVEATPERVGFRYRVQEAGVLEDDLEKIKARASKYTKARLITKLNAALKREFMPLYRPIVDELIALFNSNEPITNPGSLKAAQSIYLRALRLDERGEEVQAQIKSMFGLKSNNPAANYTQLRLYALNTFIRSPPLEARMADVRSIARTRLEPLLLEEKTTSAQIAKLEKEQPGATTLAELRKSLDKIAKKKSEVLASMSSEVKAIASDWAAHTERMRSAVDAIYAKSTAAGETGVYDMDDLTVAGAYRAFFAIIEDLRQYKLPSLGINLRIYEDDSESLFARNAKSDPHRVVIYKETIADSGSSLAVYKEISDATGVTAKALRATSYLRFIEKFMERFMEGDEDKDNAFENEPALLSARYYKRVYYEYVNADTQAEIAAALKEVHRSNYEVGKTKYIATKAAAHLWRTMRRLWMERHRIIDAVDRFSTDRYPYSYQLEELRDL